MKPGWLQPLYDAYHALGPDRDPAWSVSVEVAEVLVDLLSRVEAALAPEKPLVVVDAGSGLSSCVIRRWAADLPSLRTLIFSTDLEAPYLERARRDSASVLGFSTPTFVTHDDLGDMLGRTPVHVAFWDLGRRADRMRRLVPFVERYSPDQIVLDDWNREPDAKWMGHALHQYGYEVSRDRQHADPQGRYAGLARRVTSLEHGVYKQCRVCGLWGTLLYSEAQKKDACASCRGAT